MPKSLTDSVVLNAVAEALDAAERPARKRAAAARARLAQVQAVERRRWVGVVAATLAELRPIAAELARWRAAAPKGGALLRDRCFSRATLEASDRVLAQAVGLEDMVGRYLAALQAWHEELAGPMDPERFASVVESVREAAPAWPKSAASGLKAHYEICKQACVPFAEAVGVHEVHMRWFTPAPPTEETT